MTKSCPSDDREADARQSFKLSDACSELLDVVEDFVTTISAEQLNISGHSQTISFRQIVSDLVVGSKTVALIVIKYPNGLRQRFVHKFTQFSDGHTTKYWQCLTDG